MGIIYLTNQQKCQKRMSKSQQSKKSSSKSKKFTKSYKDMIKDCLQSSNERKGLSTAQIKSFIKELYHGEVVSSKAFNKAMKSLVTASNVTQKKGHYKMTKNQKANKNDAAKKKEKREKKKKKLPKKKKKKKKKK